jgi:ubiquinone/menaquinone biosynthesis C-methylase UbiE
VDVAKIKERTAWAWGQGEYGGVSELIRPAADALREALEVTEGQHVLDVAAGDGNFAVAAAREGATVVAADLAPGMVERGRARTDAEGYSIEWVEADAEDLPFEDGRFDCVGSVFGAMIAPRPRRVAEELFRVTRSGGTVGMTAWTPDSAAVKLFSIGRRYQPPPPDMPRIEEWGDEDTVRERFHGLAARIAFERRTLPWGAESLEALEALLENSPMAAAARAVLPQETLEAMRAEQRELVESWVGGAGPVSIDVEYLLITARKRG